MKLAAKTITTCVTCMIYTYCLCSIAKIVAALMPHLHYNHSVLSIYLLLAISAISYPLGTINYYTNNKLTSQLAIALILLAIGLLPTYQHVGYLAPMLFFSALLIYNFVIASQLSRTALSLNRNYTTASAALGIIAGVTLTALAPSWRMPFIIGALLHGAAHYLRNEQHNQLTAPTKINVKNMINNHSTAVIQCAVLAAFTIICPYTCNIDYVSFLVKVAHCHRITATSIAIFGQLCILVFAPLMYNITKTLEARSTILIGLIGVNIITPLLFILALLHSVILVAFGQLIYALFITLTCIPLFRFTARLFPSEISRPATAISWSIGIAIFGGTLPLVNQLLGAQIHMLEGPASYISLMSIISFLIVLLHHHEKRSIVCHNS